MPLQRAIDLTGKTFGELTVLARSGTTPRGYARYRCRCSCGAIVYAASEKLRSGRKRSCDRQRGPLRHRRVERGSVRREHRLTYGSWLSMRRRIYDPAHHKHRLYGARGITLCDRWGSSFAAFLEDMKERPGPEYSIDRIDRDKGYEPSNCRWATAAEQRRNSRDVIVVEIALFELARLLGLDPAVVRRRYRVLDWPLGRALRVRGSGGSPDGIGLG